ncbi:MAG: hypothetical protein ABI656_12730 [bacterium]
MPGMNMANMGAAAGVKLAAVEALGAGAATEFWAYNGSLPGPPEKDGNPHDGAA